jgi:hypothetical protein
MKSTNTNPPPLSCGETVIFQNREYRVIDPGIPHQLNAELKSCVNPRIILFVDPAEFILSHEN